MKMEIQVKESAGLAREAEYLRVALPCARGMLLPGMPVGVTPAGGSAQPCQQRVLKTWPDGSVKWLLLDFQAQVPAGATLRYLVEPATQALPAAARVEVTPGADAWTVQTGKATFRVDSRRFRPLLSVTSAGRELLGEAGSVCRLAADTDLEPLVEQIELEDPGPLHAVLRLSGSFAAARPGAAPDKAATPLRFVSRLHFFAGTQALRVEFTLHNPAAASHPGGLWDLGDRGSVLFDELSLAFALPGDQAGRLEVLTGPDSTLLEAPAADGIALYQESSGGANWQSSNHRNRDGVVPLKLRGYLVESAGRELAHGLRAAPTLWCGEAGEAGIAAALPNCWQEFPKELRAADGWLSVGLFPGRFPDRHELQGGERKTHSFALDFAAAPGPLAWALAPLKVAAAPLHYRESAIFADLPDAVDLVDRFSSAADLLAKREIPDEYGWRNFGELYADHEAAHHEPRGSFVSHYNNQYDCLGGAYRKFFATGNFTWEELASDLARHVLDIDIYHTDLDREEYNRGLFWHTSHYIDAGLSTHRTMSREHLASKDPRYYGGGPGFEHCYTTGLMYRYFLTGNPDYREAVQQLALWCFRALTGSRTVLATLHQTVRNLKLLRMTGSGPCPLFPRFPLTRGTGNCLTACLDAFEASGEERFLALAEELIRGALHPEDDLEARDLLNAEICWSYTVLLAAIGKFLQKKEELGEFDAAFDYARASLLAYAGWMLEHERPYLERPEQLEFPNETWAGQDLRKSVVFYHAARHAAPDQAAAYLKRAAEFYAEASRQLEGFATSSLTRPVALMLQNGWVGGALAEGRCRPAAAPHRPASPKGSPVPFLGLKPVAGRFVAELAHSLGHLDVKREAAWLRARVGK